MSVGNTISNFARKCKVKISKHSPTLCLVFGIGGVVAGTVLACNAVLKVKDKIDDRDEKIKELKESYAPQLEEITTVEGEEATLTTVSEDNDIFESKAFKKDLFKIHAKTYLSIGADFAPALLCTGGGIALLINGHKVLNKRYLTMSAAYMGLNYEFQEYRKGVCERFGPEVDQEIRYGVKRINYSFSNQDGTTEEKEMLVTDISKYGETSLSTRVLFDETSAYWSSDPQYNLDLITLTIHNANEMLANRGPGGVMFLNEVLDMLDLPRTPAGQMLGWKYDPDITCKIDAGIYNRAHTMDQGVINFLDGDEPNIWLDFNVDGNVLESI